MFNYPKPFFKEGDTVLVRSDNCSELWQQAQKQKKADNPGYMSNPMNKFRGQLVTIKYLLNGSSEIVEDKDHLYWSNASFMRPSGEINEDIEQFLKTDIELL